MASCPGFPDHRYRDPRIAVHQPDHHKPRQASTPSTKAMVPLELACRIGRLAWHSGPDYHDSRVSWSGTSITSAPNLAPHLRPGWSAPPRTRNRPPHCAILAGTCLEYSAQARASCPVTSPITCALAMPTPEHCRICPDHWEVRMQSGDLPALARSHFDPCGRTWQGCSSTKQVAVGLKP